MNIYKKLHIIFTVLSFIFPLVLYIYTMAPTASFWDCGEFIATSYILGVPHPPGSPLFLLLGNVFTNLPFFNDIGARVNLISPIVSAFSVMFLYLIIVQLIEEFQGKSKDTSKIIINNISAFLAALTFAVTDSHWFNAVEAEVYSLSTFFTAIVIWMILKWASLSKDSWNIRYLLLIAYMIGLAIGVHILNLLTLPFIVGIIYFKKYEFNLKSFLIALLTPLLLFVIIYSGIILGLPDIISKFNSIYIVIVGMIIVTLAILFLHLSSFNVSFIYISKVLSICAIIFIGLITYNKLFIKSVNNISNDYINKLNAIDDSFIFYVSQQENQSNGYDNLDYDYLEELKKDRAITLKNQKIFEAKKEKINFFRLLFWQTSGVLFGFIILILIVPACFLFYNNYYNNYQLPLKVILSCFLLILIGYSSYTTIFIRAIQHPRINENNPDNLDRALSYINRDQYGAIQSFNPASAIQSSSGGHWRRWTNDKNNPSFSEQMNFVWNYQIKEMYLRYFAWQFIGRSDKQSDKAWLINDLNGDPVGNRNIDGIDFFRYGFPLVFLFGLLGIYFHFTQDWKRALAVLSVFLATGLMLVLYLNQYDPQPRERDYSYVGSFFAFSIWVGIGISFIQHKIKDFFEESNISSFISITIACFIFMLMTFTMSAKDYKEHSRYGNYVAWDYGYNLLNSCEPNAIIFTNGDNDTFPLWYLQEVEHIRRDIQVVNLSLLNTPWYIEQLMDQEPKLDIQFNHPSLIDDIYSIESDYLISTQEGYRLCSREFTGEVPWSELDCDLNINEDINFQFKVPAYRQQVLRIQDYMILQLINDLYTSKPIYFAATVSESNQVGLGRYLQMEGMTYRLVSEKLADDFVESINYDKMKLNLTQADINNTIKTVEDYNNAIVENKGIYRYRNLNNEDIVFSDNIKRLVQNYRIGYLRLMQYQLKRDNIDEVKILVNQLHNSFSNEVLPMDPWLGLELIKKIYSPIGDIDSIKLMVKHLIESNADINVKLIAILEAYNQFESGSLIDDLISDYIIKDDILMKHKLALLDEIMNKYMSVIIQNGGKILNDTDSLLPFGFINHMYDNLDNFSYQEKVFLYQALIKDYTISFASLSDDIVPREDRFIADKIIIIIEDLLNNHYATDLNDVDYQKALSDQLLKIMGNDAYLDFAAPYVIDNLKIEGMLYTTVNIYYKDLKDYDTALSILNSWISLYPNNQRMINKRYNVLSASVSS